MQRPKGLRFRRRVDDPGRIGVGAGGQDGVNSVRGVLNARFVIDGEPTFQCDLAVITGLAATYHDRIEVRRACQGHLEFVPAIAAREKRVATRLRAVEHAYRIAIERDIIFGPSEPTRTPRSTNHVAGRQIDLEAEP